MPEKFGRFLYDYNIIRIALIIWVIVGFFNNWDYSDQWGCILQIEPVFRSLNIIFSFISLIIIASTFLFRDKKVKTVKIHENIISIEIGKKVKKYLIVFKSEFYANLFVVLPDSINYDLEFMKKHKTNYRLNPEWKDNSSILFIKMGKDSLIFSEGRNKEYKLKKL